MNTRAALDLVVRNGRVIDPSTHVDGVFDVGVQAGRVVMVEPDIARRGRCEIDASGRIVVPGLIDIHVHLSSEFNGRRGHAMLARAGVTTALDLAGPTDDVMEIAASSGIGLTVGCLQRIVPGELVGSTDPAPWQVERAVDAACASGALGVKILGGHFPLTPDASARIIAAANDRRVYVAFHAGTTETKGDTGAVREAIQLTGTNRLHLPHLNSYCRGASDHPAVEAVAVLSMLSTVPHVFSESYMSPLNGTWGDCREGVPASARTIACLVQAGFTPTERGLEAAIERGYCLVHDVSESTTTLVSGRAGVERWRSMQTRVGVSFRVNPPEPRLIFATAKTPDGAFCVDALATDGGGIPRNDLVASGLALVALGALTLEEWLQKACVTPARLLGLGAKGRVAPGSDADLAVIDVERRCVDVTIAGGRVVMAHGEVRLATTRWLSSATGAERASSVGLSPYLVDVQTSGFYTGDGLTS